MINVLSAATGLFVGVTIIVFIRRDRLLAKHGFFWLVVALGLISLGLLPQIVDLMAASLGVGYPPILVILLGFATLILKALVSDLEASRLEVNNIRAIQRLAILEKRVRDLEDNKGEDCS